ncbi:NAD(P)-dependent oxidoreductase [Kitasatospora sp. NPDC056076]|uniref:NAD(P)-dependent oxidoreductase n=1 Tax=Kitasatospora sp. NPDC056076 TaxID=3345703 RepID=UPI0035DA511B
MSAPVVAVLGAGVMARAIAPHLRGRYRLRWFNRTPGRVPAAPGEAVCANARQAAAGADAALALVGDDEAAAAVWDGPAGAIAGLAPGAVAVECSTLSAPRIRAWTAACSAAGIRAVDCPLTGGRERARAGTLIGLAGGEAQAIAAARPLLDRFTERLIVFGPSSSGSSYKLVHNLAAGIALASVAEALGLARALGLDEDLVLSVLGEYGWAAPAASYVRQFTHGRDPADVGCSAANLAKDVAYATAAAESTGRPTALGTAAHRLLAAVPHAARVDMAAVALPSLQSLPDGTAS